MGNHVYILFIIKSTLFGVPKHGNGTNISKIEKIGIASDKFIYQFFEIIYDFTFFNVSSLLFPIFDATFQI